MIKENLRNLADKLPNWLLSALLAVILTAACDSGPTTGGTGNDTSGNSGTQPNTLEVNEFLQGIGEPPVAPPADGTVPLFAP